MLLFMNVSGYACFCVATQVHRFGGGLAAHQRQLDQSYAYGRRPELRESRRDVSATRTVFLFFRTSKGLCRSHVLE